MALSAKRQAFVDHYLREWDGAKAARLAGYSAKTARQQASRLLTNVDIQDAIAQRLDELKMSADQVLLRLSQQARGEYAQYIRVQQVLDPETGQLRPAPVFDLEACAADGNLHLIKRWKYDANGHLEIEFFDAQAALVQLGRHHKLFTDRTEIPNLADLKAYIGISPDDWDDDGGGHGEGNDTAPGTG